MLFINKRALIKDPQAQLAQDEVLQIEDLHVSFKTKSGVLRAVRGVDLTVLNKEIVGVVGESGSGKSVCVKTIIGFNDGGKFKAKRFNLQNIDITKLRKGDWPYLRGTKVSYIPQDPLSSLNPVKRIESQILETIYKTAYRDYQWKIFDIENSNEPNKGELLTKAKEEYEAAVRPQNAYDRMIDILKFIGIQNPEQKVRSYPHEFSGGMRQRIIIAMAIAAKPKLIIADEPTTALDVTIQAKVLDLIKKLRDDLGISVIMISHNIALVANFCDFIYVMYAGKIVERGTTKEIFTQPSHPYTWALISSIPDSESQEELKSISGTPPNMLNPPRGDAFAPRNPYAMKIDFEVEPPMFKISQTHYAATWLLHENAPRQEVPEDVRVKSAIALASIRLKEANPQEKGA